MSKARQKLKATIYDKRGRVLSVGENSYRKTHPKQAELARAAGREEAIYLHAEIAAIIKLRDNQSKAHRIYVERYGKNCEPLLAKPCEICQLAIDMAGIDIVEYT
jgi:deoxycytidylate deaminase